MKPLAFAVTLLIFLGLLPCGLVLVLMSDGAAGQIFTPPATDRPAPPSAGDPSAKDELPAPRRLQPSSRLAPVGRTAPPASEPKAGILVGEALEKPVGSRLTGEPLPLARILAGVSDSKRQKELVGAHWRLFTEVALYHFALRQHTRLAGANSSVGGRQATAVDIARAASEARLHRAAREAVEAQHGLAELLGREADGPLPLPVDPPLTGAYRTHYDVLFGEQPAASPARRKARRLHDTLPLQLSAIRAQARAVAAALRAREAALKGPDGTASSDLAETCHQLWREQQSLFNTIRDYNVGICDYALVAAPQGTGGLALVPMLIKTTPAALASHVDTQQGGAKQVEPRRGTSDPREPGRLDAATAGRQADPTWRNSRTGEQAAKPNPVKRDERVVPATATTPATPPRTGEPAGGGNRLRTLPRRTPATPEEGSSTGGAPRRLRSVLVRRPR